MSTRERKARKRAGIPFSKPRKTPAQRTVMTVGRRRVGRQRGLGLVSGAEILAGIVVRGAL